MPEVSTVEEIKERLGIEEVIGSYIKIEKAGANLKAKCPFHNEKTPSFFISPDRNTYYCFGCGAKGDIFNFIQEFEGVDFVGSLKILADRAGVDIKYDKEASSAKSKEKEEMFKILEATTTLFQKYLEKNDEAKKYLKERGIDEESISKWRIGYAPDEWESVLKIFKSKSVSEEKLSKVGLIKKGEKGKYYDRFRGRIMFPIFDPTDRVVGFTGRLLKEGTDPEKVQAKYINSPETELFNKSKILYGYNFAKTSIRKNNFSILVEGQVDVVMAHQAGYLNTVASSGTALVESQLDLLNRLSNKMVIALDGDVAGLKASEKAWKMALSKGMDVKIAAILGDSDPADLIQEDKKKWVEIIKKSKHIIDYLIQSLGGQDLDERQKAREIHQNIVPYIANLESSIEKSHFVDRVAKNFKIHSDAVWEEVNSFKDSKPSNENEKKVDVEIKQEEEDKETAEKRLIGIILWQEGKQDQDLDVLDLEKKVIEIISEEEYKKRKTELNKKEDYKFETEKYYEDSKILKRDIKELLKRLEKERLLRKRETLKERLRLTEASNDKEEAIKILKEINKVSIQIEK